MLEWLPENARQWDAKYKYVYIKYLTYTKEEILFYLFIKIYIFLNANTFVYKRAVITENLVEK